MVVHIITRLAMGGAQQLVYEIAKRMHQTNRDVIIFTGLSDTQKSLSALDNNILEAVYREKIPVEVIPYLNDKISLINDIKSLFKICALLRKYNPSVVHIHSSKTGILARLACKLLNVKNVIYHVHGWFFSRTHGLERKFYIFLEKLFYNLTDKYIFVCKQDLIDFINYGGNTNIKIKSHIIYPGAEFIRLDKQNKIRIELRSKLGFSDNDHVVGTVGRLDFQKNPQIFLEIANSYSKIDGDAKFLWIGKGPYKEVLKKQLDELGLSGKFILPGYIEDAEPYFTVFDTFIISSRYEGLPLTVLKSLACGIPVVGFLINGINDLSKRFKMVYGVNPFFIDEFGDKLVDAKQLLESNKKIIEKETNFIRNNFHLNKMYDNIIEVYDSLQNFSHLGANKK